jgi:hypothetical protein
MENTSTTQITYNFKPSKADIIQRLLDEKHITVEEAMTLMAPDAPVMPTPPYTPPTPSFPAYPPTPMPSPYMPGVPYPNQPWITYCQTHTGVASTSNSNQTVQ